VGWNIDLLGNCYLHDLGWRMGTGTMRLNEHRVCPAVMCRLDVNPYVIHRGNEEQATTLECPSCGHTWRENISARKTPEPGD
jgi:hypothetical protein